MFDDDALPADRVGHRPRHSQRIAVGLRDHSTLVQGFHLAILGYEIALLKVYDRFDKLLPVDLVSAVVTVAKFLRGAGKYASALETHSRREDVEEILNADNYHLPHKLPYLICKIVENVQQNHKTSKHSRRKS